MSSIGCVKKHIVRQHHRIHQLNPKSNNDIVIRIKKFPSMSKLNKLRMSKLNQRL